MTGQRPLIFWIFPAFFFLCLFKNIENEKMWISDYIERIVMLLYCKCLCSHLVNRLKSFKKSVNVNFGQKLRTKFPGEKNFHRKFIYWQPNNFFDLKSLNRENGEIGIFQIINENEKNWKRFLEENTKFDNVLIGILMDLLK